MQIDSPEQSRSSSPNCTPNETNRSSTPIRANPQIIKIKTRRYRKYLQPQSLSITPKIQEETQSNAISTKQTIQSESPQLQHHHDNNSSENQSENSNKSKSLSNKETRPAQTLQGYDEDHDQIQKREYHYELMETRRMEVSEEKREEKYEFKIEEGQEEESEQEQCSSDQSEQIEEKKEEAIIQPTKNQQQIKKYKPSIRVKLTNIQESIKNCLPPGYHATFLIKSNTSLLGMQKKYNLYIYQEKNSKNEGSTLIASAKKEILSWNPCYIISTDEENHSLRSQGFLGLLTGNFSGTQWHLYDKPQINASSERISTQYSSSLMGSSSIRQLNGYKVDPFLKNKPITLSKQLLTKRKQNLIQFTTACPKQEKGKYKLDFRGMAKIPSAKNFIINYSKAGTEQKECLLFAKQTENSYIMQVGYPLTLLQAFGLCLTSLNGKILVN